MIRLTFLVIAFIFVTELPLRGDEPNPVAPRKPPLPSVAADSPLTNPVDRFLQADLTRQKIDESSLVSDRVFARRVYQDLVGLLPDPQELDAFVADQQPEKRRLLVQKLLGDRRAYAEHWMTFWNDALRNAYRGTGFIDDGRRQITGWLFESLYDNKPYNQFVHELISPVDGSEGFIKGIVWRGVVNASQRRELQAAQTISQVFMGTNIKCASCHDNFLNDWKLSDSYGLANVFAEKPLETFECNKPNGEFAPVKFLYPQLGKIDARAPRKERIKQLADVITSPNNGRLSRTVVNRLWAIFFGRGIVEPVDDMAAEPWNRDLLDWLAADLAEHGYDLKHTMELICTSRAYQSPSVGLPPPGEAEYAFRGPYVKRMSGEQFLDAVAALTGVWPDPSGQMLRRDGRGQGGQITAVARVLARKHRDDYDIDAQWIWNDPQAATATRGGVVHFRRAFELASVPASARAVIACDNSCKLFVNGEEAATGENWQQPASVDLEPFLKAGRNVFAVHAVNGNDKDKKPEESSNPAGLLLHADIRFEDGRRLVLKTDSEWICSAEVVGNWEQPDFNPKGWQHAVAVADVNGGPWQIRDELIAALITREMKIRAALIMDDELTRALGRSNREQVVTRRESIATTLQALELTNGHALDAILKKGAENWLRRYADANELVSGVYAQAIGRTPTPMEQQAAIELIGMPPEADGVQDLLWVVLMLPEFQLVE